jgi:hypothetical protein
MSLLVALGVLLLIRWVAEAQGPNEWSKPQVIYETAGAIDTPYLVADPFGQTHLFWREHENDSDVQPTGLELLYYAENRDGEWSGGIDIVADAGAIGPSATVDAAGTLHLAWLGPGGTLYHAYAPAASAGSALNWSRPMAIASTNLHAHILADASGIVHLVYPGTLSDGVYYSSMDAVRGGDWSAPVNVAPTAANNVSAEYARMAVGPDGTLHVVWSEFMLPEGWPPTGVYYAQSKDGGESWSMPVEIAGDDYDQITVAVAPDGRVHVAWNGMVGVGGRYHRWSADGGLTWSPTVAVVPPGKGGTEGPPQLAIDNDGIVHMLTTFDACAWHAALAGNRWSEPVCISGPDAMASNYIEEPALTLVNGNQLHVVFWDDRSRLWHTTRMTDAPPSNEVLPVPKVEPIETEPDVTPTLSISATVTSGLALPPIGQASSASGPSGPGQSVLLAVMSAFTLVGCVVLVRIVRTWRHERSI